MSDYYEDLANDLARTERYDNTPEDDMPNPGAKRFIEAPKKPYTKPHLYTGDEMPVEMDSGYVFFDLPPLESNSYSNWDSVDKCRAESLAMLDKSENRRKFISFFWAALVTVLAVCAVLGLIAGAFYAVRWFYTAVLG